MQLGFVKQIKVAKAGPLSWIILSVIVLYSPHSSCAVETGFYPRLPSDATTREQMIGLYQKANQGHPRYKNIIDETSQVELGNTVAKFDRVIHFSNVDEIDIGLGKVESLKDSDVVYYPIYLTRTEAQPFLQRERHKDLLVINFYKSMMGPGISEKALTELQQFFDSLGYKRIIVLGSSSSGRFVLKDQEYASMDRDRFQEYASLDPLAVSSDTEDRRADRVIRFENDNKIDIGIVGRTFTQRELEQFLKNERHKGLLIVHVGKSSVMDESTLAPFVNTLGYQRAVFKHDLGFSGVKSPN